MNDRELLELAAKAAGIQLNNGKVAWKSADGLATGWTEWNPLTDDGDALRLAVKLEMTLAASIGIARCDAGEFIELELSGKNPCAAVRRSIVRAAAEIGRNMK